MNEQRDPRMPEFAEDGLYREESFTDRQVGTIRRLTPVTVAGAPDDSRPVLYMGATQVMTAAGPMPLNFDIQADGLDDACKKFGSAAQQAVEEMAAKLEELRREQASSIVVPGRDPGPAGGGSGILGV
jgi:hypothetical protein